MSFLHEKFLKYIDIIDKPDITNADTYNPDYIVKFIRTDSPEILLGIYLDKTEGGVYACLPGIPMAFIPFENIIDITQDTHNLSPDLFEQLNDLYRYPVDIT